MVRRWQQNIECACSGRELWREKTRKHIQENVKNVGTDRWDPNYPKIPWPNGLRDSEGYPLCGWCGKIQRLPATADGRTLLVTCPSCGLKFKGPKPWMKIDYECENCE